jgi:hypothetical protein
MVARWDGKINGKLHQIRIVVLLLSKDYSIIHLCMRLQLKAYRRIASS